MNKHTKLPMSSKRKVSLSILLIILDWKIYNANVTLLLSIRDAVRKTWWKSQGKCHPYIYTYTTYPTVSRFVSARKNLHFIDSFSFLNVNSFSIIFYNLFTIFELAIFRNDFPHAFITSFFSKFNSPMNDPKSKLICK